MSVYENTDVCMARTTLVLDDTQMLRLKSLARTQGRTMTELINEFIAEGLAARTNPQPERVLNHRSFINQANNTHGLGPGHNRGKARTNPDAIRMPSTSPSNRPLKRC